jgi:hypothetical protein
MCPIANIKPFVQEVITLGLMCLCLGLLLLRTYCLLKLRGRSLSLSGGECSRTDVLLPAYVDTRVYMRT